MSQHRRPPAGRFPLAEHRIPAAALFLALLAGAGMLLLWRRQQDFHSPFLKVTWGVAWLWLALAAVLGRYWWHALARGWLVWTGEHWQLRQVADGFSPHDAPRWQCTITLDLQSAVLLHLRPVEATAVAAGTPRRPCWVWARGSARPAAWQGLRQALVWEQQQQGRASVPSPELSA